MRRMGKKRYTKKFRKRVYQFMFFSIRNQDSAVLSGEFIRGNLNHASRDRNYCRVVVFTKISYGFSRARSASSGYSTCIYDDDSRFFKILCSACTCSSNEFIKQSFCLIVIESTSECMYKYLHCSNNDASGALC